MQVINREQAREFMQQGDAVFIETLPEEYFKKEHLPRAMNIPPDEFAEQIEQRVPDKSQKVVLYCADEECPASTKSAKTMDELGYENVYDYEAGKKDWKEAGLPLHEAGEPEPSQDEVASALQSS